MTAFGDLIPLMLFAGFGLFILILIVKKRKGGFGLNYKPVPFADTVYDPLRKTLRTNGTRIKHGSLYFGNNVIHNVIRVTEMKGKKPQLTFDNKTKVLMDEGKETTLDLICFEVADSLLSKLFKVNTDIYLFDKSKVTVVHDPTTNRWFLPENITWYSYGDIWICDGNAKDFARDLAMSFFDETSQTHLINTPNRVVALEIEHAKKVNIIREKIDAESGRYQPPASASETTVESS